MKRLTLLLATSLLIALAALALLAGGISSLTQAADERQVANAAPLESSGGASYTTATTGGLSHLPLSFIANAGQTDPAVRFTVKGAGHTIFFSDSEIVLRASGEGAEAKAAVVRLRFPDANLHPRIEGLSPLPGKANFYAGAAPAAWRVGVPTYGAVVYHDLYPGIDLVYSGSEGRLKSEFRLAAGADPAAIQMAYSGLEGLYLRPDGALALETPLGTLVDEAPRLYQEVRGRPRSVTGGYALLAEQGGEHRVGFRVGRYDPARPLVIDPELTYSSFLGGGRDETARAIVAYKSAIYIAGQTSSMDFALLNPLDNTLGGQWDAFVTKFITTGGTMALSYSTYLGGSFNDEARGLTLRYADADNSIVYLTGRTDSADFPTQGAAQATYSGGPGDAFVVKLKADGTLGYATYLGGSGIDEGNAIAFGESSDLWGAAKVYVTGRTDSTNFPANVLDTTHNGLSDAFVTQVKDVGDEACAWGFSTFLGGAGHDVGYGISEEWPARVAVTGRTESNQFPVKNALDATYNGNSDAFVTQILSTTTSVQMSYSTFLGGAGSDIGYAIYVWLKAARVTGRTDSADFPTRNAFQPKLAGGSDAFVTKIISGTNDVTMDYSTYLGGRGNDEARAIARGWGGSDEPFYVAGRTGSNDWPARNAVQPRHGGGTDDAFVTQVVTRSGSLLMGYSTTLGGRGNEIAYGVSHDSHGVWPNYTYVASLAGSTDSTNWPTTADALDKNLSGQSDAFLAQLSQVGQSKITTTSIGPDTGGQVNAGGGAYVTSWNFYVPPAAVAWPNTTFIVQPVYYPPPSPKPWTFSLPPLTQNLRWGYIGSQRSAATANDPTIAATAWLRPITVTVQYDPAGLAGTDENTLRLYGQDAEGAWHDAACAAAEHPECTGYHRDPANDTFTVTTLRLGNLALDVARPEKAITGRVTAAGAALPDVQILPSVGQAYAVRTDASGRYTLTRVLSGTYTITPTLAGYTFTPAQRVVVVAAADVPGQDFTGAAERRYLYLPLVLRN